MAFLVSVYNRLWRCFGRLNVELQAQLASLSRWLGYSPSDKTEALNMRLRSDQSIRADETRKKRYSRLDRSTQYEAPKWPIYPRRWDKREFWNPIKEERKTRENIRVSRIKEEKHELSADGSCAHFKSRRFNVCKCEIIRAWRLIYDSIYFERTKKELHRELDPVFPIER